jgi:hypothetical protein
MVPVEILNNIGILRLRASISEKFLNLEESKKKSRLSLEAFTEAVENIEKLMQYYEGQKEKETMLKSQRISTKFNLAYWHEENN